MSFMRADFGTTTWQRPLTPIEELQQRSQAGERLVVWCHARRVPEVLRGYRDGCRVGVLCGGAEKSFSNSQCFSARTGNFDQYAAECWAVLKAVEWAATLGPKAILLRNSLIGSFRATRRFGYRGEKYLWIASRIAVEKGIDVQFERCRGDENLAAAVSG